ncbi:MAG: hypothetical protein AVDCRST_MAG12-3012, partial [uncultured Rubrobacteraceae bacterium]
EPSVRDGGGAGPPGACARAAPGGGLALLPRLLRGSAPGLRLFGRGGLRPRRRRGERRGRARPARRVVGRSRGTSGPVLPSWYVGLLRRRARRGHGGGLRAAAPGRAERARFPRYDGSWRRLRACRGGARPRARARPPRPLAGVPAL